MFLKCWGNVIICHIILNAQNVWLLNVQHCTTVQLCLIIIWNYLAIHHCVMQCECIILQISWLVLDSLQKNWNTLFCCCLVILFLNPGTKKHLRFSNIPSLTQRSSRPARTLLLSKLCFRKGPGKWESSGCCQNLELDALRPTNGLVIFKILKG